MIPFIWQGGSTQETPAGFLKRHFEYRQQSEYVKTQVKSNIEIGKEIQNAILKASNSQIEAIHDSTYSTNQLLGSIDVNLDNIVTAINNSYAEITDEIRTSHELQKISHILEANIAHLLRIPDSKKELQSLIEDGFQHYHNSFLENTDTDFLLESALKKFLKAEEIAEDNYLVLNIIGLIYLNSTKFLDVVKAENYLIRAAKYADSQISPDAQRVANILSQNVNDDFSEIVVDDSVPKRIASNSYYNASIACYIQLNYKNALENAKKAFEIGSYDAGYSYAKFLLASGGDANVAADVLEKILLADRFYLVLSMQDEIFINNKIITNRLTKLTDQIHNELKNIIEFINANILEDSYALNKKNELENNFKKADNLLSLLELKHFTDNFHFVELGHFSRIEEGGEYVSSEDYLRYTIKDCIIKEKETLNNFNKKIKDLKTKVLPDSEAFEILNAINLNIKTFKEARNNSILLDKPKTWKIFEEMNNEVKSISNYPFYYGDEFIDAEFFNKEIRDLIAPLNRKREERPVIDDYFEMNYEEDFNDFLKNIEEMGNEIGPQLSVFEYVEIEDKLKSKLEGLIKEKNKRMAKELEIKKNEKEDATNKLNLFISLFLWPYYLIIYLIKAISSMLLNKKDNNDDMKTNYINDETSSNTIKKTKPFVRVLKLVFLTFAIWLGSYIIVAIICAQIFGEKWKNFAGMFGAITLLISIVFIIIKTILILTKKK